MKIMVILQNQWFKDPERMRQIFAKHYEGRRHDFIRTFLFFGCRTGRNLRAAFGEESCDSIIWEEASPQIGGHASSAFAADPRHIADAIREHKPDLVVALGRIACDGVAACIALTPPGMPTAVIYGPHPTARQPDTMKRLREIGAALRNPERPLGALAVAQQAPLFGGVHAAEI